MTIHKKSKASKILWVLTKNFLIIGGTAVICFILLNWAFVIANAQFFWQQNAFANLEAPANQITTNSLYPQCYSLDLLSDYMYIPAIKMTAPIKYPTTNDESVIQESLQFGVVHYPNTAKAGAIGNTYYLGHSSDWWGSAGNYKTVFALLPKLKINDWVYVSNESGKTFGYQVVDFEIIKPNNLSVLSQNVQQPILTLQTSYPLGTALLRYIVRAHLACTSE